MHGIGLLPHGVFLFGDHGLEAALREGFHRRAGVLAAQQALGRHDDQGLAQVADHLPAQHVKDLAGRCGLHDLHVGIGCELHEAL